MPVTDLSWGVSVVGTGHENDTTCATPAPDVIKRIQTLNGTGHADA